MRLVLIVTAFIVFFAVRYGLPIHELPGDLDPNSVRTGLAILALAAILWLSEALPLALTALLIPILASLTGVLQVATSFSGFAHPLIFLFLGGFGLAAALSRQGLDAWLAQGILRIGRGRLQWTAIALFSLSAGLSMWISNTATVALLLPVVLGILNKLRAQHGESIANSIAPYLLLGIAYSASVGGIGTLIGSPPNAIAAANLGISFTEWMRIGIPSVLVLLPILFVVLFVTARPAKVPRFELETTSFEFTLQRGLTLIIFALAICGWLFSSVLSDFFGVDSSFDTLVAVSAILLLASCRLVSWRDIDRGTDWGVLLLFGGGITLSKVLGSTGASRYLANEIQNLITGLPLIFIIGGIVLFVIFLTELSSNAASAALLVPIFMVVALDMGVAVHQLVLPLTLAASCAFMLPIATPPNAIVFGSGLIPQKKMIRIGFVLNMVFTIALSLFSYIYFSL